MPLYDQIFTNLNIATMTFGVGVGAFGIIHDGVIGVKDGRFDFVGIKKHLPTGSDAITKLDCQGMLALPGLIDCHTHAVFAGNRAWEHAERMSGTSYETIAKSGGGILSTVWDTRQAQVDDLAASATKRLKRLKSEGVTHVEVKSGYGLTLESELKMLKAAHIAAQQAGVGLSTTLLAAHAVPPEFQGDSDGYVDHIVKVIIPKVAEAKRADAVDAFCENIGFTPAQTARVFKAAAEHHLGIKLHADQLSDLGGGGLAAKYSAQSADHLEFANEDSLKAMAKAGTIAVLLPGAFYMLKETQKPPVDLMRQCGVKMAVATDLNPGTSPMVSLQLAMHMACNLFDLSPFEAVQGVTTHAAMALGLHHEVGAIGVGMRADMAIFEMTDPAELTYWLGGVQPAHIICRGRQQTIGETTAFSD